MPRGVDSTDLRVTHPVRPLGAMHRARSAARRGGAWLLGAALVATPVGLRWAEAGCEAGPGAARRVALAVSAAQAQSSPVSELWRELETLRVQWRVEVQTLRIDIDRFRQRVAKRRWELRRRKNESGEP